LPAPARRSAIRREGPEGLAKGKKIYIVLASGGVYSEGPATGMNHAVPYLTTILGFLGMTDVEVIRVEGVGMGADATASALEKANARIDAIATQATSDVALAA
jgi:FMN-dependent NADH-azoreductase